MLWFSNYKKKEKRTIKIITKENCLLSKLTVRFRQHADYNTANMRTFRCISKFTLECLQLRKSYKQYGIFSSSDQDTGKNYVIT